MKVTTILPLAAAAYVCAASLQDRAGIWLTGQTVNTTSGLVSGHGATNQSGVSEYLGIPFAQPPIGDLRFAAPVKFTGSASLNGTSFGPSCPVKASNASTPSVSILIAANITEAGVEMDSIFATPNKYSEDCLYLNVWTKPQTGEDKKAVLVWIYGGGFNSGSAAIPGNNGANIAELEDVVVVSFNYRLSILGFPGNPAGPNNLALLDQRLAIEWVRDNIEKFGGDKSRVTLFGQSAGSVSVDLYSYAWVKDPIASGFIAESGTAFSWGLPHAKADIAASWFTVTATLGCGNASSDSTSVLSCMRSKTSTAILGALPAASGIAAVLGYFGPTIDDTVVFANYSERTPAKLPVLVGSNNYEAGYFRTEFALANMTVPDLYWDEYTLQDFTCPAGIRANASVTANSPIWRYRYFGDFPNTRISSEAGAWHGAEMPIIFDTMPSDPASTPEEISISSYMRGAWAAFAKDPVKGLTTYGWPSYDVTKDTLIRLAYDNITGTNAVNPAMYDANCVYVNVSSTDAVAGPLATPGASTANATSKPLTSTSGSASGSAATATASSSGGGRFESQIGFVLAVLGVAWFL
ncbi:Acetylcholinesterase [Lachnellula hyalina]|uniref:Carboxylic ester hydrolase n=1 Tax=Lachnellula hyalina TaxID=1316788 RepID=A0A8H8QWJ7_9HELO|nr:Acetylcholinesterase [Lachnellula hyalina]TVY24137.1 Acetylcholinesterase [Lachnellula hyalina]